MVRMIGRAFVVVQSLKGCYPGLKGVGSHECKEVVADRPTWHAGTTMSAVRGPVIGIN